MASSSADRSFESRDAVSRFVRAGILTAITDGLFSSVLNVVAYHSTVARLWQGVAATVVGSAAFSGGARTVVLGLLMHCGVALAWSAVFVFGAMRVERIRRLIASRAGALGVASVYGPLVWMAMSLVVIPALVRRPPSITVRWWVQFFGHIPFVGAPIVLSARHRPER